MNSFKTGYKSHYNIPRDLFRCGGSRLEVFLAMFVLYFWINISFGRKKIPQPFHFICFYYLLYRVWHSLNGMMDLWRMCMSIQRCFLIIRFVDAFVTLPLVFFSDIFVMPNFPLSLERTDTTFRLLQKIADFICLW